MPLHQTIKHPPLTSSVEIGVSLSISLSSYLSLSAFFSFNFLFFVFNSVSFFLLLHILRLFFIVFHFFFIFLFLSFFFFDQYFFIFLLSRLHSCFLSFRSGLFICLSRHTTPSFAFSLSLSPILFFFSSSLFFFISFVLFVRFYFILYLLISFLLFNFISFSLPYSSFLFQFSFTRFFSFSCSESLLKSRSRTCDSRWQRDLIRIRLARFQSNQPPPPLTIIIILPPTCVTAIAKFNVT
ncbi:unnamed protein product [Acanthosepion pharaonis]|uniref:Uncharacterized protein n=1 Tax=Acanthosepion pharaonis TaxID=158019 RepID=A0A812EEL1_ACAPH|nr:unnamed protein product [Sepia pharaonis]